MSERTRGIVGWIAVVVSTVLGGLWTFWGAVEAFHEGWYRPTLLGNLALALGQYLLPAAAFVAPAAIGIRRPRLGALLHFGLAAFTAWFFAGAGFVTLQVLIVLPIAALGLAYAVGRPRPAGRAMLFLLGTAGLVLAGFGGAGAWRVAHRVDDGDRGIRMVEAGDLVLVFAPRGPGWPVEGVSLEEAERRCRHLAAEGDRLLDVPPGLWRLPTADELVRLATRGHENGGGRFDPSTFSTDYRIRPDKETPLWDPLSPIIYWWTATRTPDGRVLKYVYDGRLWPIDPKTRMGSLAFRAVRAP